MVENDLRGAPAAIGVIVLAFIFSGVIFAIYPGWIVIGGFVKENIKLNENFLDWVSAFGPLAAIFFAGRQVAKQMQHSEVQRYGNYRREDESSVWSCLYACQDAKSALYELHKMFEGDIQQSPVLYSERIEGLEETVRLLLASRPHPSAVAPMLTVLAQLAYARTALREYKGGAYKLREGFNSFVFYEKASQAVDNLCNLYKLVNNDKII